MNPITFKAWPGAAVSIEVQQAAHFVTVKTEQIAALTSLIADASADFEIEITKQDLDTLTVLASELAFTAKNAVFALVEAGVAQSEPKGGA